MSTDAKYILYYEFPAAKQNGLTHFERDLKAIEESHWWEMEVTKIDYYSYFIDPLKYTLDPDLISSLEAEQVLEQRCIDPWVIVKKA